VDLFTVPSEFAREKYALSGRIALDKMRILPNVVDDPGPAGDSFPMKGALYVGRMAKEKGLSVLVDAWEILAARGLKIPLTLVGEGPMRISLEERVRKAAIPCVRFEGWQEGPALQQCFRSASFVIQPSLSYETFGRVVIEAYACGRPVIVSRVGALPGLVRQGLTGLLTEPGNSFSIAEAVQRLAGDSAAIEQMGREARRAYEAQYRPERTLAALEAVYAEAMRCGSGNVN
jgi:glycosyltransferase involved in cell wall biosynthesis